MTTKTGKAWLDSGKEKEAVRNMEQVFEEKDRIMAEQAQAIDERQNEIETLSTELQTWQEKCSFTDKELEKKNAEIAILEQQTLDSRDEKRSLEKMEEEIQKLKEDRSGLETQLQKKDEEIKKGNDSRDGIMQTMREALEVSKANKAEYEVKLATVREQCRQEMRREKDEEMRRAKRDFQKKLDEKDSSLEEIKSEKESVEKAMAAERAERSKTDSSSSDPDTQVDSTDLTGKSSLRSNQKKNLKRTSSDLTLAELKNHLSATKTRKADDSDEEFTPGSVRKTRSPSTKKAGRPNSTRSKRTITTVDILPTMDEKEGKTGSVAEKRKLFQDLQENKSSAGEESGKDSAQTNEGTENIPPKTKPSTTKKRGKLFQKPTSVTALLSPAKTGSRDDKNEQPDKTRNLITRQLRPRAILNTK